MAWFLITLFVILGRFLTHFIQKQLLVQKNIGFHKVLVIGLNEKVGHICETIKQKPQLGYQVVDYLEFINIQKIKEIKETSGIDEIIIYEEEMPDDSLLKLYDFCQINNVTYKLIPSLRQAVQFNFDTFDGEPIIEINHTPLDGWGKIAKRIFDTPPLELYDAAKTDGASSWKEFWYITLPWLQPTILVALLLRTLWMFNEFDITYLMAFGGPMYATTTLPVLIRNTAFGLNDMGRAAAIGMLMVTVLFTISFIYIRSYQRAEEQLSN